MKTYEVSFRPRAEADLRALYRYIARTSGRDAAGGYIDRIEAACLALARFPNRGTKRDDVHEGLRTIGFERRATIAFQVVKNEVVIVGIFYGGRDFGAALKKLKSLSRRLRRTRP